MPSAGIFMAFTTSSESSASQSVSESGTAALRAALADPWTLEKYLGRAPIDIIPVSSSRGSMRSQRCSTVWGSSVCYWQRREQRVPSRTTRLRITCSLMRNSTTSASAFCFDSRQNLAQLTIVYLHPMVAAAHALTNKLASRDTSLSILDSQRTSEPIVSLRRLRNPGQTTPAQRESGPLHQ